MRRPFLAQYKRTVELRSTGFNLVAIDLALARRLALSVVLGQAAVTVVCALASWLIAGPHAALSAAMGGGISTAASLVMALLGFGGKSAADGQRAMRAFFIGETAKIALVIVLFVVVLKTMKVVPLAMLGTYVATFCVFWVALANMLPPLGGTNVPRGRAKNS
jgi:ATP synthase protein I